MAVTLRDYDRKVACKAIEGKGLTLIKEQTKTGRLRTFWRYRFTYGGKQQEMTLVASGNLARDRKVLTQWQAWHADGKNPRIERDRVAIEQVKQYGDTFASAVEEYLPKKVSRLVGEKNQKRLVSLLETYAIPKLGRLPLSQVDEQAVLSVLEPIWTEKYPTAKKVLSAINQLMLYKGHVLNLTKIRFDLPKVRHKETHLKKLETAVLPSVVKTLWANRQRSDLFLLATILTASRTLPVRMMRHDELDFENDLWRCPRTKSGEPFDFPLSKQAKEVIQAAQALSESDEWVFPQANNPKKHIDENSGRLRFQRASKSKATVHGCRAILHDWADPAGFDHLTIELTLQHQALSDVEKAYQRSRYLERRRKLIDAWGEFCWSEHG